MLNDRKSKQWLVGEIQSDNVTVGFDRPTDNERNSINSEIKSDYEQMDLFNNEKDESGATGFTDEEIMNFSKRVVALKMVKNEFTHFLKNTIIHKNVLNF